MSVEEDVTKRNLQILANQGSQFAELKRNPAFGILQQWLQDQINDKRNKWLDIDEPQEAELLRIKASVYKEVSDWINLQVKAGERAQKSLEQLNKGDDQNG